VDDDIEIEVTGLRSGEKLFEELYSDSEQHRPTQHAKIMVAAGEPRKIVEVLHDFNRLAEVLDQPNEVIREILRQIIPIQTPHQAVPQIQRPGPTIRRAA
jgi:FlaA1/EpsC-like NDP-sugar epimerase